MEFDQACHVNALHLLHREFQQLDSDIYQRKKHLQSYRQRLERATARLHLAQQQVDLFRHETQVAKEKIKDASWSVTKEVCAELGKLSDPTEDLLDLVDRYMRLLDQRERSWKSFQTLVRSYATLRALMDNISPDHLTDEQLTALLPVWKNQYKIQANLSRFTRGAVCIAQWISHCVEYKLKMETLNTAQKSLPDLEYKIKKCVGAIAEKTAELEILEKNQSKLQAQLEADCEGQFSPSDQSLNSMRSTAAHPKSRSEELPGIASSLRFMPQPGSRPQEFQSFEGEGYVETPGQRRGEVEFGETSEYCGCKGRLFCL